MNKRMIDGVNCSVEWVQSLKVFRMAYEVPSGMGGDQFRAWKDKNEKSIQAFYKLQTGKNYGQA